MRQLLDRTSPLAYVVHRGDSNGLVVLSEDEMPLELANEKCKSIGSSISNLNISREKNGLKRGHIIGTEVVCAPIVIESPIHFRSNLVFDKVDHQWEFGFRILTAKSKLAGHGTGLMNSYKGIKFSCAAKRSVISAIASAYFA
jgi:hypothetical protein